MDNSIVNASQNLSIRLKELMEKSEDSKTIQALEKTSGVAYSTIRRILAGTPNPTLESLVLLAGHFRCTVDELIGTKSLTGLVYLRKDPKLEAIELLENVHAGDIDLLLNLLNRLAK